MLSVLLPYRDAAPTLARAIGSVIAEPEVDELVLIDDGSRDVSSTVARGVHDPRIVHLKTRGVGIARALALGAAAARNDIIARMDADDVSLPGRFRAQLELLRADDRLGAIGTPVRAPNASEGMRAYIDWQCSLVSPDDHARDIFVESPLCHPSVMMRRAALDDAGGYIERTWPEDWDLWLRMHARGWRFAKTAGVFLEWNAPPNRITKTDPRCSIASMRNARAAYLAPLLRGRRVAIWGAGPTGRRLARALEQHGIRASSFIDIDPRKIGRIARGVRIASASMLPTDSIIVAAVGARGARALIRNELLSRGLEETRDFVCAA